MKKQKLSKQLIRIYGVGNKKSRDLHRLLGVNHRVGSDFLKNKHKEHIEKVHSDHLTGKLLKLRSLEFLTFKKKIKSRQTYDS